MECCRNKLLFFHLKLHEFIKISAMFESDEFLSTYLPLHFSNRFSQVNTLQSSPRNGLEIIRFLSQFLALSHKLYAGAGQQKQFSRFLQRNFKELIIHSSHLTQDKENIPCTQGIIGRFLPKLAPIFIFSLKLYTKVIDYQVKLKEEKFDAQKKMKLIQDLAYLCEKIRFQFELIKMAEQNLDADFDTYIEEIIEILLSWNLSISTQAIIELMIKKDQTNVSDKTKMRIKKKIEGKRNNLPYTKKESQENKKCSQNSEHSLKVQTKNVERLKKISSNNQCKKNSKPNLSSNVYSQKHQTDEEDRQSKARLKNFLGLKKHKPIIKERTLYQQRKATHNRKKINIPSFQSHELKGALTQTSLNSSFIKESLNFEMESEDEFGQNVLVQSTPKQNKKNGDIKIIHHKLSFFEL